MDVMGMPWLRFLSMWGSNLLLGVIYIAGIVLSVAFWRRHPRASLMALLAFVLFLLSALTNTGVRIWLIHEMNKRGGPGMDMSTVFGVHLIVHGVLTLGGWTLLLLAIFGPRHRAERTVAAAPVVFYSGPPPGSSSCD